MEKAGLKGVLAWILHYFCFLNCQFKLFDESFPITGTPYSTRLMDLISQTRGYEFDLLVGQWSADFPALFRAHNPVRISNQRLKLVDCETIDKDPLTDDLSVICGWGTDLGVDFQGKKTAAELVKRPL